MAYDAFEECGMRDRSHNMAYDAFEECGVLGYDLKANGKKVNKASTYEREANKGIL